MNPGNQSIVLATVLAAGVALAAGLVAGTGLARVRGADGYVRVKGVAEREVRADVAIWPIHVVAADNDLNAAHARLERNVAGVRQFLSAQGLDTMQISLQGFSVSDAWANEYPSQRAPAFRFVVRETVVLRSADPDKVLKASQRVGDLASIGVSLSSGGENGPTGGPTFIFSGLNALKPQMIADATARAREAADQFARDSHSSLGAIRQANQGVFEILPRDEAPGIAEGSQVAKRVRVVSTIDYFLKN